MKFVGTRIRTPAIWAMIPLTLLGGTPLAVCICAGGEQKYFCRDLHRPRQVDTDDSANGCCKRKSEHLAERIAVPEQPALSSRCCQRAVECPSPRVVVERMVIPTDVGVPSPANLDPPLRIITGSLWSSVDNQGDLPPPDL